MKGFYIFESETRKEAVDCLELGDIVQSHRLEFAPGTMTEEIKMQALVSKETTSKCSKDDTYDFEVGALIALMKMCGLEKSAKAYAEIFDSDALIERDKLKGELCYLKKDSDKVIDELIKENTELHKNIDELFESEQHTKTELGRLCFEKHRLEEENEKLQHEYNLCLNSENALKYTVDSLNKSVDKLNKAIVGYKNDLYNTAKRCKELEEENKKLKLDCEKLQHGYNDMIFCGGRQNGKQYTLLVELFKKIDQKKVDAAYKEAYGSRVIWCSSQSSTRDMLDSLLYSCKYAILTDKDGGQIEKWTGISEFTWELKVPTKREEMWEKIFEIHKESDVIIKVKKEDVNTFLHEIEKRIPEITWVSTVKIFETKYTIGNIYGELKTRDVIYFRLSKETTLSYSSDPHVYPYRELKHIDYLPPMRWDLFKKGRIAVKVNYDNYKEFYEACEKELGRRPLTMFPYTFTVSICKKDGLFEIFTIEDQKKTGRKIVDWEDVR